MQEMRYLSILIFLFMVLPLYSQVDWSMVPQHSVFFQSDSLTIEVGANQPQWGVVEIVGKRQGFVRSGLLSYNGDTLIPFGDYFLEVSLRHEQYNGFLVNVVLDKYSFQPRIKVYHFTLTQ